jgi:hypothetical protein
MIEVPTSGGADGTIAFEQNATSVNLWRMTLSSGALRQLTGDALNDYWPSSNADATRVAFQRARPTPEEGFQFIDARVLAADATRGGALEPQTIDDGFGPRLSADGSWVAYYQRLPERTRLRLLVKNLSTGEVRTLAEDCTLPSLTPMPPIDWFDQTMTWGSGSDLYFLAHGQNGQEVRRAEVGQRGEPSVLTAVPQAAELRDVRVSSDGSRLAFLVRFRNKPGEPAAAGRVEVRVRNLRDTSESVILREPGPVREDFLPGWTSRNSLVVQRAEGPVGGVFALTFSEVALDGTRRPIATVGGSFASTVRLDQGRDRLFVTRAEGGIHNVHLLDIADGKMRQLTANEAPGVTFSGVQPLGSDAIVFARDERRRDIWLVKRKN